MALDPALLDRLVDRRRVVVEEDAERWRARIELARRVLEIRQLDERVMLPDRQRGGRRRRLLHETAGILVGGEGQRRFDLGVLREALGARQVERAAALVEAIAPLARLAQAIDDAMRVAHEEG